MPMMVNSKIEELEQQIRGLKKQLLEARKVLPRQEVEDYTFKRPDGSDVRLSQLFGDKKDLLVIHNMGRSCPYCTLWADGFNGFTRHFENRAGFALVSPDPVDVLRDFGASRGWKYTYLSGHDNDFAKQLGFHTETDGYWPGFSTFRKDDDGKIYRVGCAVFGPGDDYCSIWPMLDLFQDGPDGWEPKYTY